MLVLIFDTEFTSLILDESRLLEISYIIIDEYYNIYKKSETLIRITKDIVVSEFIQELTGITPELLKTQGMDIDDALTLFLNDVKKCDFLVAHNISCDKNIVLRELKLAYRSHEDNILKSIISMDSIQVFKSSLLPLTSWKLIDIYNYLFTDEETIQSHRALADAEMIYKSFKKLNINFLEHYWNLKIFFGKYKYLTRGEIADKDVNYFKWLIRTIDNVKNKKLLDFINEKLD